MQEERIEFDISYAKNVSETEHPGYILSFLEKGMFRCNEESFVIKKVPGDGRCGYHTMQFWNPLEENVYENVLKCEGWATHTDFEKFSNYSNRRVYIYSFTRMMFLPELANKCEIPNDWRDKIGLTKIYEYGADYDENIPFYVLHQRKHYDPIIKL
ncbi:hypothetical protein TetV_227 [Tetraselmis virus 1]|uniref:Uncharacterized protein n=1 Tax=Tetraselmis virus 1 TaxID=2060617 RepID=A0A2P0VNK0_9VIRU|nr:hypothetical protein QJ968_gp227 [Tetraselmis virus 1]AUF82319.1 hypothetical protein TetV_227 [Tetraselmis virus 1]